MNPTITKRLIVPCVALLCSITIGCNNSNPDREKILQELAVDTTTATPVNSASSNDNALAEIRKEEKVKEAIITDAQVLYVSVFDDGTRRDGYAEYLCQVLKENGSNIKMVKVVEYGTTKAANRDNAYGVLLGESYCP